MRPRLEPQAFWAFWTLEPGPKPVEKPKPSSASGPGLRRGQA